MKILGIQTGHDPSVSLFDNGKLIFYNEERKVIQEKHYNFFPFNSLLNSLNYFNKELDFCFLSSYNFVKEELQFLNGYLKHLNIKVINEPHSLYASHHLTHAFKAFVDSKFKSARVFVVDNRGSDWFLENKASTHETCSVYDLSYEDSKCIYKKLYTHDIHNEKYAPDLTYHPDTNKGHVVKQPLTITDETVFDVSHYLDLGLFYSKVSQHYGFENEEGKFMGFQSYGTSEPISEEFTGKEILSLDTQSKDQASSCQELFEHKYKNLVQKYKHPNMVFTGGTALNVVNNYKLHKAFPECNLWFDPLCGDGGNSIGIVYAINVLAKQKIHPLENIYIGNRINSLDYSFKDNEYLKEVSLNEVVELLTQGNVVGLIQGKAEAGPRALGNRSLLLDPTLKNAKDIMNDIKKREHFRPFACSILEEKADTYFDMAGIKSTPFMMHAPQARPLAQHSISSLVHVDNTCRIQTVNRNDNNNLHKILKMFPIPVLMNTSFNLAGYPIVDSLDDIMNTVRSSSLKYVYFADFNKLLIKS